MAKKALEHRIVSEGLISLDDAVLPLIRSRNRDLWRYSAANEHGGRMHDGVATLQLALADSEVLPLYGITAPSPQDIYRVAHKALASAIRVIARADDSAGIIGDACHALIEIHPRAAALANVSPLELADWVYEFHFDDEVDYFNLDPVAYAPALGQKGLARLQSRVDALRAEIPPSDQEVQIPRYDHREFLIRWFDKRFAVLNHDIEAIIRTHLRDGRVAAWHEDVAEAFEEVAEFGLAIEWAERATMFGSGHQSQRAADRWQRLLSEHRPLDLTRAVHIIFERWPTAGTAARLVGSSGSDVVDEVQATLESRPAELVRFQLDTLGDARLAWGTATRLDLTDGSLWSDLAAAYLPIDPVAAIRVQVSLVEGSLMEANTRKYRPAARELGKIRKSAVAATGTGALALVDTAITALRERYKRRPRLITALDQARLP